MINTDLRRLKMIDFFQFITNVAAHLQKEDLEELKLKDFVETKFLPAMNEMDNVLKLQINSAFTKELNTRNKTRIRLLSCLYTHIKLYTKYPENEKVQAAERLTLVIKKFGKKVSGLPQRELTGVITQMLQDLQLAESVADLKKISAMAWVNSLKAENIEFEKLFNSRTVEKSTLKVGVSQVVRKKMQECFTQLIKLIEAQALINGADKYKRLMDEILTEVKQAKTTIKRRGNR